MGPEDVHAIPIADLFVTHRESSPSNMDLARKPRPG